ncbi:RHS repeat domain-containing protein [Aquimarina pacifica]|uniref:hypothetical protein n=1 Tax=Aquimarina pacifica TaxID=1296415 RepID=UPI00047017C9|nr:hypothetical protein [Aquimarina pacifica]
MKNFVVSIALCCSTLFMYAQTDDGGDASDIDASLISFPTSPEAGKLGTFGNIPVNLSAGQMSYQIPLHTIQVNGYSWPISLNYSFGGLILEDKPSINGMSWSLSAGGTVVREVRGIPDEHPRGYYGSQNYRFTHLLPYFNNGEITENTIDQILAGRIDSEPDKYTLSVNGINFSFKIDTDNNPVYLSKHNYTVFLSWEPEYDNRIDKITLIDDKGFTYIFDQKERNEPLENNSIIFNDGFTGYTSSWMLSKVILPNNEEITLSYITDSYESLNFYASGYYNYNLPIIKCSNNIPSPYGYSEGYSKTVIYRKLLASIESSGGNILFTFNLNTPRITYSSINSINSEGKIVHAYQFEYEGNRDILTSITKNETPFYNFEYYNQNAIPKFYNSIDERPYAQDRWGFYNGATNNHALSIPYSQYNADKTPSPDHTMIGGLSKIIYPTRGYSLISYEENQIKSEYSADSGGEEVALTPNREILVKLKSDNSISASDDYKQNSSIYTFDTDVYATISHSITSNNNGRILASINKLEDCTSYHQNSFGGNYPDVATYYRNTENVEIPMFCPALGIELSDGHTEDSKTLSGTSGGTIIIPKGTYEFKIFTTNNKSKDVYGFIKVWFHELPDSLDDDPMYINKTTGGIRVKSIIEYSNTETNAILKQRHFDYSGDDNYSSGVILQEGVSEVHYKIELGCSNDTNTSQLAYRYDRANYTYKTYNPVNLNQGVPIYYLNVKEYQDRYTETIPSYVPNPLIASNYDGTLMFRVISDTYATKIHHYINGYTKTSFESPQLFYRTEYPVVPNGIDQSMGRVNNEQIFRYNTNDSIHEMVTQKEIDYLQISNTINPESLNDNNPLHPSGLKIGYDTKKEGLYNTNTSLDEYYIFNTYKEYDNRFLPKTTKTTSYYPQDLSTIESQTYDSYYQLSQSSVTKSDGNTRTTNIHYPYDINSSVYNSMVNQNVIAYPVMQVTKHNDDIISSSKTEYVELSNTLFKPKEQMSSKGDLPMEARIQMDRYDIKGNLLQYHKIVNNDQASNINYTSILWGYNDQYPIAKIENANYEQIASALGISEEELEEVDENSTTILTNLRTSLPESMITTYSYDPLIGVNSITDPRGYTTFYQYDYLNRLEYTKDQEGNLISRNKYQYKN